MGGVGTDGGAEAGERWELEEGGAEGGREQKNKEQADEEEEEEQEDAQDEEEQKGVTEVHETKKDSDLASSLLVDDRERWVQQDIEIVHHGVLVWLWQ